MCFAFILIILPLVFAQESSELPLNNEIFVDTAEDVNEADYASESSQLTEAENNDIVHKAVKVFKSKGKDKYSENTYVIKNPDGTKRVIVEREYSDKNGNIVFSGDGESVVYFNPGKKGGYIIQGVNISSQKQYNIATGSDYKVYTCPSHESYIAVQKDGETLNEYMIYDFEGNSIDTVTYTGDINDISSVICY